MQPLITYGSAHPSIGVWLGPLVAAVVVAVFLVLARLAYRYSNSDNARHMGEVSLGRWFGRAAVAGAVLSVLACAFALYPYQGEYHHWQKISGTVTSTNSRFISANKGTDQKFVVTFDGSDQQFGCSDTRCAGIRKGDYLTITCKRSFQWFGTPGYDCNYVSYKPAGGAA